MLKAKLLLCFLILVLIGQYLFVTNVWATYIFSDEFEVGNGYTPWTSTTTSGAGTIAIATDQKHDGVNSSKVTYASSGDLGSCYKDIVDTHETYTRFYVRVDNLVATAWTRTAFLVLRDVTGGKDIFEIQMYKPASGIQWRIIYRSAGSSVAVTDVDAPLVADTWTCIEAKAHCSSADGQLDGSFEVWIDGVSIWSVASIDTDSTNVDRVRVGVCPPTARGES